MGQAVDSAPAELLAALTELVSENARRRAEQVERGELTPRLAAVLLQRYGDGVFDAAAKVLGSAVAAMPLQDVLEAEAARLDPLWREHREQAWRSRPCDLQLKARIGIPQFDRGLTRSKRLARKGK